MRFLILLLSFACASCSVFQPGGLTIDPADLAAVDLTPGATRPSVAMSDGSDLLFYLDVPDLAPGERVPFVMAMPYAGTPALGTAQQYRDVLAAPGLRDLGAIVVVPVAFDVTWDTQASVSAVASFVEAANEVWPIDADRVIVTGYSNGGNGTWAQVDQHSDLYSAAIPMAGVPPPSPPSRVPLVIIHGEFDELFSVAGARRAAERVAADGGQVEYVELQASHYQAGRYAGALADAVEWIEREVW